MKSRIILFVIVVLTMNSLSVVYGDETKALTSVRYATTISEANAVLHLALRDQHLKKQLKDKAQQVYKIAKKSNDQTLVYIAYKAYIRAQKQEGLAIMAYERAKKRESSLRKNMTQKFKTSSLISSRSVEAKKYLEYALSIDKKYDPKVNFIGYIAGFFNIDIEGDIGLGESENSKDSLLKYTMNQAKPYNVTIMARKTIFEW